MSIQSIATRLSKLKANTAQKTGLITFSIGALYSAYEARKCGYTDQVAHPLRWSNELQAALYAARDIARARRPSAHGLVCNVHFNSALWRIDVGFERLLRHVTGSKSNSVNQLVLDAQKHGISSAALKRWREVRSQVNALKHQNPSALIRNRMKFADMLAALDDLTTLLESKL